MYSHVKLGSVVLLTVAMTMAGCKSKSNKEATILPPPPPLESEPMPASLSQTPAPAAPPVQAEPVAPPPPAPMAYEAPTPAPAPAQPIAGNLYRVKPGDTLWSIAKRHYGHGEAWRNIAQANNIADPHQLKAGMDIILP